MSKIQKASQLGDRAAQSEFEGDFESSKQLKRQVDKGYEEVFETSKAAAQKELLENSAKK